jgi:carboxypeptidase C (cathepsin A)
MFYLAYTLDEPERPITFIFPGGPGAAATSEAIFTFGPRRLLTADEGRSKLPPYELIDNTETLLEFTDLVFVDPPECGFSRITENGKAFTFHSVEGDIHALSDFIQNYLTEFQRWNSPKYLAGGSYGTVRCAGVALNLLQYDIAVSGMILDGCAIDYGTIGSERDRALPDCLLIPTFAATAWYHGRFWPDKTLEETVDYARRFAFDSYAPTMMQPSRLSRIEQDHFYKQLSEITGLPISTLQRYNGRINESIFTAEFLAPERKVIGGLDTRYIGDACAIDPDLEHDPSYLDSIGMNCAFLNYLQKDLETEPPFPKYIGFSHDILYSWRFRTYDSKGELNFIQRLRKTLVVNPLLKVFIGAGYYDCRTPFAAAEYCFDHLDLPPSYKHNLQFNYYEAGHGLVFDSKSLKKMKRDLIQFYGR